MTPRVPLPASFEKGVTVAPGCEGEFVADVSLEVVVGLAADAGVPIGMSPPCSVMASWKRRLGTSRW